MVRQMHNLIEYGHKYSKTSGSFWQYYKDPNDNSTDSELFKSKIKITGNTPNDGHQLVLLLILQVQEHSQ